MALVTAELTADTLRPACPWTSTSARMANVVTGLHLTVLSTAGSDSILAAGADDDHEDIPADERLTPREREVLTELAETLFISSETAHRRDPA